MRPCDRVAASSHSLERLPLPTIIKCGAYFTVYSIHVPCTNVHDCYMVRRDYHCETEWDFGIVGNWNLLVLAVSIDSA